MKRLKEANTTHRGTIDTLEAQLQQARTENFSYNDVVILYEAVVHWLQPLRCRRKARCRPPQHIQPRF